MSADLTSLIAVHAIECTGPGEVTCRGCRKAGWMSWIAYYKHLAVVIESSDWLAVHDREVAAGAVEAAADNARRNLGHEAGGHTSTYSVRQWLRLRAQAIREGRATDGE